MTHTHTSARAHTNLHMLMMSSMHTYTHTRMHTEPPPHTQAIKHTINRRRCKGVKERSSTKLDYECRLIWNKRARVPLKPSSEGKAALKEWAASWLGDTSDSSWMGAQRGGREGKNGENPLRPGNIRNRHWWPQPKNTRTWCMGPVRSLFSGLSCLLVFYSLLVFTFFICSRGPTACSPSPGWTDTSGAAAGVNYTAPGVPTVENRIHHHPQ